MADINKVILTANLTSDPELVQLPSGTSLCKLRIACNTGRKNSETGQWEDKPNYFDAKLFGRQAEVASQHLAKGRGIALEGRLEWREWETQEGQKRQGVEIIVDNFRFMGGAPGQNGSGGGAPAAAAASTGGGGDDLPF